MMSNVEDDDDEQLLHDLADEVGGNDDDNLVGFSPSNDDDRERLLGPENDDDEQGQKKWTSNVFSMPFYAQFFDVDTDHVKARIVAGMTPNPKKPFLEVVQSFDLYGPIWICATLVVSVAVTGNLASYIQSRGGQDQRWHYDFHKISAASALIFSYAWLVPAAVYAFLWWMHKSTSTTTSLTSLICLYGYSLAVFVPASVLLLVQIGWLQWTVTIVAAAVSGGVIVIALYPLFAGPRKTTAMAVLALILALHFAAACGFMLFFFHVPQQQQENQEVSGSTLPKLTANATAAIPAKATDRSNVDDVESKAPLNGTTSKKEPADAAVASTTEPS